MCAFSQGYFIIFMLQLGGNIGFSLGYSWWLLRSNFFIFSAFPAFSQLFFFHFQDQLLPFNHVHEILLNRLSRTQLMKSTWINSNVRHITLSFCPT
ncbi:hypothetical protein P3S68_003607 [Capsicum galapagoense]